MKFSLKSINMKIAIIVVILILNLSSTFAQDNKAGILRNFNYIEYYPDSTIRLAMNYKDFEPNGYCIEFDRSGNPTSIGKYAKWRKTGVWIKNDGTYVNYLENSITIVPCSNEDDRKLWTWNFYLKYMELCKHKYYSCFGGNF